MNYDDYLAHFNPNHDPRNGQFAKKTGGVVSGIRSAIKSESERRRAKREQYQRDKKQIASEYHRLYNAASETNDRADALWRDAETRYKKLAKTKIGRIIRVAKGRRSDVAEYKKVYDQASAINDRADELWDQAMSEYVKLGRSKIERIINATRYAE